MGNKYLITILFSVIFVLTGFAQQTVSGLVTSDGAPLPGVNVVVKGTTNGVSTDFDGVYTLNLNDSDKILIFSSLGYATKEVAIDGRKKIDVSLEENSESLQEVVVVGFGTQRKKDLTGAVETLSSDDITKAPNTSLDQALGGQVAGVFIANRGGDAAAPINVRIRGVGTTGNNQPLFVVDGIPLVQTSNQTVNTGSNTESNPLATMNPNDIESINVLKDASAAAIYGARAANGVVIITTKRGKRGTVGITYDVYTTTSSNRKMYSVLNTEQYIDYQDEIQNVLGADHDFSQFRGDPTYDWQDAVFRTGSTVSHNISASGGSENVNYSVSAGYLDQSGTQLSQNFERYTFSANTDINVGKHFKIGQSFTFGSANRLVQSEPGAAAAFLGATNVPFFAIYDANGDYNLANYETVGDASWNSGDRQLIGLNDLANNETRIKTNRLLGSVYGEVNLAKGLKYKFTAGLDYQVGEGQWYQNNYDFGDGESNSIGNNALTKERPIEKTVNISNILTYDTTFGKNTFSFLLGHEETRFLFTKLRGSATALINPSVLFVNTGANSAANEEADEWAIRGYLGRINYNFDGKYLATVNLRRDETSRFSKDNRTDYFPSFALGWRLSQEKFMEDIEAINDLKFRASWGQAGNQFTGANNAYVSQLGLTSAYVLGSDQTVIIAPASIVLANPNLKWEKSNQTNLGLDATFFKNTLDFSVDYFEKNTKDILVAVPFPSVTGFALSTDVNLGEIKNSGFEFSVNYNNSITKDFSYGINANFSTLKNEVVDLGGVTLLAGAFGSQISRTTEGESLAHFFGYKTDGLYQTDAEAAAALPDDEAFEAPSAGDIRFVDVNGDGVITPEDKTNIGGSVPTYYYGLNLSAKYKNFDFSIFFQGVGGNNLYNQARQELESLDGYSNQSTTTLNRWTGEGTSNSFPRLDPEGSNNNNRFSDRWIESGAYTRLKNIQIGYNFDQDKLENIFNGFISNIRLYAGAQNLAVFTKYSGLDPEVTRAFSFQKGENNLSSGVDDGYAPPQPVSIQFGARIAF
ncbi:TonB-dependent receptor [Cellulophaga sp. E16_2]|uniref:SusC/RagA family TonB-linked outer membrane protein n=1 Tax=Cellulophaga sp. E16_2 TaxID=2789297 RepID=UPI001A91B722|nr:TonB-dependent receptor [Cellulophaga sp. E16_2]MBO0590177.1 TonB-dependent receptor [Cellulophaga sp. E16_2]